MDDRVDIDILTECYISEYLQRFLEKSATWMVGVMELSGLQFTMMNMLALPLIIGIGINEGVHILHRWRTENNLDIVYRSTGKAIFLTSLY